MAENVTIGINAQNNAAPVISAAQKQLQGFQASANLIRKRIIDEGGSQKDLESLRAIERQAAAIQKAINGTKPVVDLDAQPAKAKIAELQTQITQLQSRASAGTITIGEVRGLQNAKSELQALTAATAKAEDGLVNVQGALSNIGLGGLGSLLGVAGLVAAVGVIGKTTIELGNLGQSVKQQRDYFNVWSGSVANATANMQAMRQAVGNAMTDSEALAGANKLLGMGLATNATELENLTRMAVMLGGSSRTAAQSIEEFSLLLANQSVLRLDTFNISGAKVRARIEELMQADKNLSREQAFLNAVMEEGGKKMEALGAAGVSATTGAQDAATAFRQLREAIGQALAGGTDEIQKGIAGDMGAISNAIKASSSDSSVALEGLNGQLERTKERLNKLLADPQAEYKFGASIKALRDDIATLEGKIADINRANAEWGDAGVGAANRVVAALPPVKTGVDGVNTSLKDSQAYWDAWAGFAEQAAFRASTAAYSARSAMGQVAQQGTTTGTFTDPSKTRWGLYGDWGRNFVNTGPDPVKAWVERQKDGNKTAATDFQKQYESAAQKMSSRIGGYLSQGVQASIGLLDLRQDPFKPGGNGAFENIFRALDVAKLGDASPWASVLGLTQEQAKKIGTDFQNQIFSPEVMGLIDSDALVDQAKMAAMAEKSQQAFVDAIAKKAGVGGNIVSAMFGFGDKSGGAQGQDAKAKDMVDGAMSQVAGVMGDTVKGKDFAGRIIGYGNDIWGYFETGIVDKAKASTSLQAAIDGMVAVALGKRTGGSVSGTSRSQGVPGV
jgi:hypothetical protein